MKKKLLRGFQCAVLVLGMGVTTMAAIPSYLTQTEYNDILRDNFDEDMGIVVENNTGLGYLVYRNNRGEVLTSNYYSDQIEVEKRPYYEQEDKLGYLDQIFPVFKYDPRDSSIQNIKAGDCVYIRRNTDNVITYISAYNDYVVRYGKVVTTNLNSGDRSSIQIEDEKGRLYYYELATSTPVTKGGSLQSINSISNGSWVKLLVCQKVLGQGIIEEEVEEVVLDNNSRYISNVYRGSIASVDTFKNLINLKDAQALGKLKWGSYMDLLRVDMDPNTAAAYYLGNRVSFDYVTRYLKNSKDYIYIAAEQFKGKETAVKLNFQDSFQKTLEPTRVIYTTPTTVKLLTGETLSIAESAIIVRDDRLVDAGSIMVGDTIQAVVTGNNELAVGYVTTGQTTESLQVFRGRIKKVEARESFEVETFSLLEDNLWYYHPTPHTFSINSDTLFYSTSGIIEGGIEQFIAYGEESEVSNVYTIVAIGDKATMIVEMPYVTNAIRGEIYLVGNESSEGTPEGGNAGENASSTTLSLKDVYYYNSNSSRWIEYSKKNIGAKLSLLQNTVIIKNGEVIPARKLEVGDTISAMVDVYLKDTNGTVQGYIVIVEN